MTYDYHVVLGLVAVALGVIGYVFYFKSIFRGETKPHLFTWFTYFLIDIIVFTAQILNGAGPGSWVTLTGVVGTLCVALSAFRWGEKRITASDWISFIAALGAIVLWQATSNALVAVVVASVINFLAIGPTFRKSFEKPHEESISIWLLDAVRFSFGIAALGSLTLTTALFPVALVVGNVLLIAMILLRRRVVDRKSSFDTL